MTLARAVWPRGQDLGSHPPPLVLPLQAFFCNAQCQKVAWRAGHREACARLQQEQA